MDEWFQVFIRGIQMNQWRYIFRACWRNPAIISFACSTFQTASTITKSCRNSATGRVTLESRVLDFKICAAKKNMFNKLLFFERRLFERILEFHTLIVSLLIPCVFVGILMRSVRNCNANSCGNERKDSKSSQCVQTFDRCCVIRKWRRKVCKHVSLYEAGHGSEMRHLCAALIFTSGWQRAPAGPHKKVGGD